MEGLVINKFNLRSITLKVSDNSDPDFVAEWYTNNLGKYKSPAIQHMTLIIWKALIQL